MMPVLFKIALTLGFLWLFLAPVAFASITFRRGRYYEVVNFAWYSVLFAAVCCTFGEGLRFVWAA